MTPAKSYSFDAHALAENIVLMTRQDRYQKATALEKAIESLLEAEFTRLQKVHTEAMEEEVKKRVQEKCAQSSWVDAYIQRAKVEAYEDIARIIEADCDWDSGYSVKAARDRADKIRQRAKEL